MARLGSYYGLCPLIDNKSLLGISEDQERGTVIVTLGKNISIKYKLSDQKQIHSWRTKEKFTSPIIFDKNQGKYVAVFNQLYLRLWVGNEDNLDKLKKFKFNQNIHTILSDNNHSYILFKNGAIYQLSSVVDVRKTLEPENVISETDTILDVLHTTLNQEFYVGLLVKGKDEKYLLWTRVGNGGNEYCRIKLHRDGCSLTGYTFHKDKFNVYLLTLWSDGRMFSCKLSESDLDATSPGEIFTVIESILCRQMITMISLDDNYLALYGPNSNEEGALLIIYNTQFRVTQCKQNFKIFTADSKLYCVEDNLFLPVGQNLAVVPFNLDTEQLAALIGSHKVDKADPDVTIIHELEIADWKTKNKPVNQLPEQLKNIDELLKQGLPENIILESILPEILEKQDIKTLKVYLKQFCDIPEKYLVQILKFILNADDALFKDKDKCKLHPNFPKEFSPFGRSSLLDETLKKSFSDVLLLPHLKNELEFDDVLKLLSYFTYLLSSVGHKFKNVSNVATDSRIIEWGCILIDASYQKLLLTADERKGEVLERFNEAVMEHLNSLGSIKRIVPMLDEIKNARSIFKTNNQHNVAYSIEQISLY